MSERSLVLKSSAYLAAPIAAIALVGCGSSAQNAEYKADTEAQLGQIIYPQMQHIAQAALKLEGKTRYDTTSRELKPGLTEVLGSTPNIRPLSAKNGLYYIDVVMRDYPGTTTPDPSEVLVASVESDVMTKNGINSAHVQLVAPNQIDTVNTMVISSKIYKMDQHGWTATELAGGVNKNSYNAYTSAQLDTADPAYSVRLKNGLSAGPVKTASFIASSGVPLAMRAINAQLGS